MKHIFISYSRVQFYFAESLALDLAKRGFDIWFDIHRLKPGRDWNSGIHQGLDNAEVLVLVGSRAAFQSKNVRDEWHTALAAGKPIYVALFEAVNLPPELKNASIIDCRGSYDKSVQRLAECLNSGQNVQDHLPRPLPGGLPTRLPWQLCFFAVLLLSVALWTIPGLMVTFGTLDIEQRVSQLLDLSSTFNIYLIRAIALILPMIGLWSLFQFWGFLRRDFSFSALRYMLLFSPFVFLLVWLVTGPFPIIKLPLLKTLNPVAPVFLVGTLFGYWLMNRSMVLLRWLPIGEAPAKLHGRIVANAAAVAPAKASDSWDVPLTRAASKVKLTFRLVAERADEKITAQFSQMLKSNGYTRAETEPSDLQVALLSNKVPRASLEALDNQPGAPRCLNVIASSISVPVDSESIGKYQWFDFRTRSTDQLYSLSQYLEKPDSGPVPSTVNAVPEKANRLITPERVTLAAVTLRIAGDILLVNVVAAMILIQQSGGGDFIVGAVDRMLLGQIAEFNRHPSEFWPVINILFGLAILLGLALNWLAAALINRQVTPWLYSGIALAGGVLLLVGQFVGLLILAILAVLFLFSYRQAIEWLPIRAPRPSGPTLTTTKWWTAWRTNLIFLIGLTLWVLANPLGGL